MTEILPCARPHRCHEWWNLPGSRHNTGTTLSFADGHAEYWKWHGTAVLTFRNTISQRHFRRSAPRPAQLGAEKPGFEIFPRLSRASLAFQVLGRPAAPVGLLVNGVRNPLAIDRDATRFTWRSADSSRGERQMAYQILVASSRQSDLAAGRAG